MASNHSYPVRNPRNGAIDYAFSILEPLAVAEHCRALRQAQVSWSEGGIEKRIEAMMAWRNAMAKQREALIEALTTDTGRRGESILEVDLLLSSLARWCDIARAFFDENEVKASSIPFIGIHQGLAPYPLVGVISPWNFPLLLSIIDTIPALLAGCAVIVKPSEITPRFIEPLQRTIDAAPVLTQVLTYIPGAGDTGATLLENVDVVCFTGSVATGRKVYQKAAERFIPAFLELGGKDPALVFASADLEQASSSLLWASTVNCGHSCLSIERVYVETPIFDDFVRAISAKAEKLRLAYPDVADGEIGPIIAERQAAIIDDHLADALAKGAHLHTGSRYCERIGGGYWCRPTVLTNVDHSMKIMTEETFGPIIPIMPFRDRQEAIALANSTIYGLSAAVFAGSWEEALAVGRRIEAGAISINDAGLTAIIHEGEKNAFKGSGLGGSRMGPGAIKRFMRQKAYLVKTTPVPSPWWFGA
jgi:succinate-semialdehyde dehydrogenase/glutarate-semialdehyde dehydrogenase